MSQAIRANRIASDAAVNILTISVGGAITATENFHIVAANSGVADNLDTINLNLGYTPTVMMVTLLADVGDTITVRHIGGGTGTIRFADAANHDITETTPLSFITRDGGANWYALKAVGASADVPWATPGTIGSTTPNTGAFTTLGTSRQLYVNGTVDETQLLIEGHSTQTSSSVKFQTSAAAAFFEINSSHQVIVGDGVGAEAIILDGGASSNRILAWKSNDVNRWTLQAGGTESGSDTGSDLTLTAYDDSGSSIGNVLALTRSNRNVRIVVDLEIDGALNHDGTTLGVFNTAPATKQTVTGSRGGNAALASLLTALNTYGVITDSSTA
jgi:hypothetical protein